MRVGAARRRAPRAHPRRPAAARAAARVLHPRGRRNDGDADEHTDVGGDRRARRRARDADVRRGCRSRSCAARARSSGTARATSTSTSSAGSRSRRSGTRTRRSPTRSPTRRARCCTSRTSITTTCSRSVAAALDALLGGGGRVFFANSGAEANECAIKLARRYGQAHGGPERFHVISAYGSFHGRTLTTLAATGQPQKQETFQPLPAGFRQVAFDDLDALARRARRPRRRGAARSRCRARAGVVPASPEYLHGVRAAVRRARGAAHRRRGADRARSHRPVVRVRARRRRARHRHDGEGARQRRADRRVLGARRRRRRVRARRPRHDLRRPAARRARRARGARRDGARKTRPARAARAGARLVGVARRASTASPTCAAPACCIAAELAPGLDAKAVAQQCLDAGLVVNAVTPTALRLAPSLLVTDAEIDEAVAIIGGPSLAPKERA